jgi:hypothetical protein
LIAVFSVDKTRRSILLFSGPNPTVRYIQAGAETTLAKRGVTQALGSVKIAGNSVGVVSLQAIATILTGTRREGISVKKFAPNRETYNIRNSHMNEKATTTWY